jgi:hypothetical protein
LARPSSSSCSHWWCCPKPFYARPCPQHSFLQRSPSRWIGGAALIPGRPWRRQWGRCAKPTLRKI